MQEQELDYYLIYLKNSYVKKFMILGKDFFINLTEDEEEAYKFSGEAEAEDVNHYYCNGQGKVLYYEVETEEELVNFYDDEEDDDDDED